jgi:hydrogenase maturation protease
MNRALVLACGNDLRGDDGAALQIAKCLRNGLCEPETCFCAEHQWTPELAEPISKAELVIFLDASASLSPGEIACRQLQPASGAPSSFTHETSPEALLSLADALYGIRPARAFLVTVGGASFDLGQGLSQPVRQAIPQAIEQVKALLSGVTLPLKSHRKKSGHH